ncbi:MAG: hypothetical protein LBO69_07320 [Ignavibacteria bacterium]|jgi:hypothetical protein|nr:hypothetical protein [Ignavibacteria bacterium]
MNITKISTKALISFALFVIINFAFSIKYISRYTDYFLTFAIIIALFQAIIFLNKSKLIKISKYLNIIDIALLLMFIGFSAFIFKLIPVETLNVDRWSIITSFWQNFFNGEYVYFSKAFTGNTPGASPFYFILALPFYKIGELGIFSLTGVLCFYLLMRYEKIISHTRTVFLLLIMTSPLYLWEITTRSNIFLNSTLVLFSMLFFFNYKARFTNKLVGLIITGIIIGFLLSTRMVLATCFIIMFMYSLKNKYINFKELLAFSVAIIISFAITFIPFIIGHLSDFIILNPFFMQSSTLMPFACSVAIIICSFGVFLFCKNIADVIFYSGIILFLAILLHLIYHTLNSDFSTAFFGSNADISYFIFCIPFLLYSAEKQALINSVILENK